MNKVAIFARKASHGFENLDKLNDFVSIKLTNFL